MGRRDIGDVESTVSGREKGEILDFGKHWGAFGDFNKREVEEVLGRVLEDKRQGMLFVNEEGEVGGLVGNDWDDDCMEMGDSEERKEEEEEMKGKAGEDKIV